MSKYQPISILGWIDYSDDDRQKVLAVLQILKGEGAVDELGIGVIRNSLSEAMFPGITTIMTRAKYYFIIPRILHDYLLYKPTHENAKEYLRRREIEIMNELSAKVNYNESEKIIGITVAKLNANLPIQRWKELVRKPSAIYWNAIRDLKLYDGELSMANLLEVLERKVNQNSAYSYLPEEGETDNDRDAELDETPFDLPDFDKNWQKNLIIDLTATEADNLKHRFIDNFPNSLLAKIFSLKKNTRDFLKPKSFQEMCDMPFVKTLPTENQQIIATAKGFWQIIEGAHIRFNILLHSKPQGNKEYLKELEKYWNNWVDEMIKFDWNIFNQDLMWQRTFEHSMVKDFTNKFVNNWIDAIRNLNFNVKYLDKLVLEQEIVNKKKRSKLISEHNEVYKNWVGISGMDFRFRNAKIIVRDITKIR